MNAEILVALCEVFIVISLGCFQFALDIATVEVRWTLSHFEPKNALLRVNAGD